MKILEVLYNIGFDYCDKALDKKTFDFLDEQEIKDILLFFNQKSIEKIKSKEEFKKCEDYIKEDSHSLHKYVIYAKKDKWWDDFQEFLSKKDKDKSCNKEVD